VNQGRFLSILYDMALTMTGETAVRPLLTRVLQRLMYHTSFPCGVFLSRPGPAAGRRSTASRTASIEMAVGNHALRQRMGESVTVNAELVEGPPAVLSGIARLSRPLFPKPPALPVCLRLPVPGEGVVLLFAAETPDSQLPFAEVFSPVLGNLAKTLHLCRVNELHTRTLIDQREGEAAARRRFRAALDASDDTIFLIDPETLEIIDFNLSVPGILGYSPDQLRDHPLPDLLPETDRPVLRSMVAELVAGRRERIALDSTYRRRSGSQFPVEVRLTLTDPEHGTPVIIAVARDMTRRRQAEKDLRKSETLLNRAQRIASTGYSEWDLQHGTLAWSEQTFRIFGRSASEYTPNEARFVDSIHPEDRVQVRASMDQAAATGEPYVCHYRIVRPDDEIRHIREQGEASERDPDHAPLRILATLQDVTELRRMEEDLRRSESLLRQVTESIEDVFRLDDLEKDGRTVYVSPAFETVWGLPPEALYRDPLAFLEGVHPEDRTRVATAFARRADEEYDQTYRVIRPDGGLRWVRDRAYPVRDPSGKVYRIAGVASDITDLKVAEQGKENALLELAQTRKLEAVGLLAGGIAHDFNNLLTSISGFSQLALLKLDDASEAAADLRTVCESADRAAGLTRQLLAFSRKQPLATSVLNLNDSVHSLAEMLGRIIGERVRVVTELETRLRLVEGDPVNIDQVVMNLSINARDAMPQGGQLILRTANRTVREADLPDLPPDARAGEFVAVEVADTGEGMDAETVARVFDPFFTTKQSGKGTGLGLSVVYGVARQHGGWVEVDSTPGVGTTFRILIPVARAGARPEAEDTVPETDVAAPGGGHILLVEDDPSLRRFATTALTGQGYRVTAVGSVREATEVLADAAASVALVFADVILGDGSGIQLAEQVFASHPNLPVLLSSGYPDDDERCGAIREQGIPFLQKPYALNLLLDTVADLIRQGRGARRG